MLFADLPVIDDEEELSGPDLARLFGVPTPPPYRAVPQQPDISQLFGVPQPPPYRAPIDQTPDLADLAAPQDVFGGPNPTLRLADPIAPRYRAKVQRPKPQDQFTSFDTRTKTWKPAPPDTPMLPMAPLGPPDMRVTPPMTSDQEYQRYLTDFAIDSATRQAPAGKQYVPLTRPEFDEAKRVADLETSTLRSGYRGIQQKIPTEIGGGGGMKPPVASGHPGIADRAMQALGYNLRGVQELTSAPRAGIEEIGHGIEQMAEPGAAEKLRGAGKIVAGTTTAASPALLALGISAPVEAAAWYILSKGIGEATPAIAKHFGANEEDAQEISDVAQTLPLLYGIGKIGVRRIGEARGATASEAAQRFEDAAQQREQTAIAHGVDPYGFQPVDVTLNGPNGPVRGQVREIKAGTGNRKPVYQIVEENGKGWRVGDADTITNYLRRDAADQSWVQKLQQSAPGQFGIGEAPRIETPAQAQAIEQAKTFQGATPSTALETDAEGLNKFLFNEETEGQKEGSSPNEPPTPEPPSDVERVSPDTPNPPTAATPTTPEAPETQAIQLQQLTEGKRKVVMFPKGSTPPSYPVGVSVTHDPFGNIYVYRPDLIKASDIQAAAKNNTLPELLGSATLGMGAPDKSGIPGEPTHTVVARDGNGTEVQATATTAEDLPATIEATQHVTPAGGKVSVEPVGQVLDGRTGTAPEPTKPTELTAPADLERPPEDTTGLTQLGGDMGQGIVGGMREMLWQKAQAGDVTEGGQPSAVLQAAKLIRDRGGLQTPEEFHQFLGDYGNVKRDGDFQQSMRDLVGKYTPQANIAIDQIAAGLKALVDSKDPIDPEARKNLLVQALDLHTDGFHGQPLTPEEIAYWEKKITPVRDRLAKKAEKEAAQAQAAIRQAPIEDDRQPAAPPAPAAPPEDLEAPAEIEAAAEVPNKVTPAPTQHPVTYFSGTHNGDITEAAQRRGDIGLLITPLRPDLLNKADDFPVVAVDNGAFSKAKPFSEEDFTKLIDKIAARPEVAKKVRFVVAPDVPMDAAGTVAIFDRWADYIHSKGLPVAFAAQNGIEFTPDKIPWDKMDVLFIGGDTAWKTGTHYGHSGSKEQIAWTKMFRDATAHNVPVHMGRVNSGERLNIAEYGLGASSVDGNFLAYGSDKNLPQLEGWLNKQNKRDDLAEPAPEPAASSTELTAPADLETEHMGTPASIEKPIEQPAPEKPEEAPADKPSTYDAEGPHGTGLIAVPDSGMWTVLAVHPQHQGGTISEDDFPLVAQTVKDALEERDLGFENVVGYAKLTPLGHTDGNYHSDFTEVVPDWRRKGIASALYDFGEKVVGAKITPSKAQTEDGEAFNKARELASELGAPASIEQPAPEKPSEKPPEKPSEQSEQSEQSESLGTPQALEPEGARGLVNAVYDKLKRGESLGNVTELTRMAEQHFGSGRTDGEWSVKDMFDAMEAGINKYQVHIGKDLMELPFDEGIQVVRNLMARITSQGTRTDEQVKRQQFSTPPSQAYLAVKVADVKPSDIMLEPSAGTGDLVALPKAIGATVYVNEIAPRRIEMLEAAGLGKATNHDGELIHSLLDPKIKPTVIVMNPPFSTSTRQGDAGRNRNTYGFNHVNSALQRLEPGGRLVVILGGGQANEPNGGASLFGGQSGKWFEKVARNYTVRANVRISGREYQKYGTSFATRLIVIDKTGPTPDMSTVVQGNVDTLEQAYELLRPIAESRPELQARPGSPASTGQQGDTRGGLATGSGGVPTSGGRTTAGGASSNAQDDTGSESVRPDGDTAGNAPRPGGQPPTRVEPDSGPTSTGAGESPQGAASAPSDDDDERPVQPPEVTERQQLESVDRGEEPDQEDTQAYVTYRPTLKGAPHPGEIVETKAMATVPMPKITYKPALPKDVIEKKVSAVQLEGISLAGQQNEIILPSGARSSVLIGDGTGVGKGREAAGILLDNWLQGRKRLVWVSKSWNLTQDALRDFDGLGATDLMRGITRENGRYIVDKKGGQPRFVQQGDFDAGENMKGHKGLVFTTYTLLPTADKRHNTRLAQLENYLRGDDDGEGAFILFDESHLLKNAVTTGRGAASQVGIGVRQILDRIPKLRTASLSATAATDVTNLGYLGRLGLWGPGTAFPSGFEQFGNEMAEGGIAAMELVARELKAEGKYLSRTLSFKGVTYETATHKLNPDQRAVYKTATQAWDVALRAAMKTIEDTTNGGSRARSGFMSQLGGAQQRFFSVLLTTLKIPTAVEIAKQAERDGFAVAISLINTNEASQNREKAKLAKRPPSEDEDEQELDFGPKEILTNLIRQHYPIHQYADSVDPNGKPIKVLVMRPNPADPTGPEIAEINPQAEAERDALLAQIDRDLHLPENPLDSLVKALGGRNKVAELTGRTEIYDRDKRTFVPRGDKGVPKDQINIIEMAKFQDGEKNFAVLSSAADTGISLHASNQAKNQRRRMMITLQVGWSADKAQQMLGRVHRTDQASAPHYVLLVSDMGGEMRFISTIARRIASLGALTKGQKDATGGNDLMSQVDFQGEQGIQATQSFYEAMLKNQEVPGTGFRGREILSKLRVLRDGLTVSGADRTNVNKLLNNLLALEPDIQNQVYKYYFEIFQAAIQAALENNTLDTGVRSLPGDEFFFKEGRTIATNSKTGATTHYQPITVRSRIPRLSLAQREQRMRANAASNPRVVVRSDGKKMALLTDAYPVVHADGSSTPAVYAARPERSNSNRQEATEYEKWRTPEDFAQQKQAALDTKVKEYQEALERREKMLADAEAGEKERRRRAIASRIPSLESRIRSVDQAIEREEGSDASVREYYATARQQAQDSLAQAQKDLAAVEDYKHEDAWLTRDIESIRKNLDTAKAALEPWKELFEDPEKWGDDLWTQLHDDAPAHEDIEHHFITGAVFSYWNAIRQAAHVRTSIFTASDSHTRRRIVGIEIPDGQIRGLLGRIEGGGSTVDATQMIIDVLRSGLQYQLEAGIEVVRGRVTRENVIQLLTSNPDVARRLTALGAVYERGVMPTYYIPNRDTHQILSRILEEYPVRTDTPPPASRGGNNDVYTGFGLGALQSAFDNGTLTPHLKKVSRFFSQVADDTKRVFAPQTRGSEARIAAGSFREMMGTLAQKDAQVHAALNDYKELFYKLPEEHGVHGLSVIDAIEGGPQAINSLPAELRPFATTVRGLYEDRKNLLDGLGLVKHFLENYFTHMYKNPAEAEAWTANWLSKRPLPGKESFRKQRVYPTLREALEDPDFSLVAKFDNPVDYVYAGLAQMDKSIAAHDLFNEWQDAGYLKYSLKRPDGGYSQIDDKLFTVRGPRRGAVKIDPEEPTIRPGEDPDEFEDRHQVWEDKMEALDEGFIKPGDVRVYGQRTMGHYWAPDQMAQVANNYLSPGLHGKAFYDAWMKVKGGMNAINLGFSAFHALTTTLNSSLSDIALGFEHLLAKKPLRAASSIGRGFTPFASIVQDYLRGTRLGKVWDGTAANPTAQELAIVDALRQAGGRYKQSNEAAPLLEGLKQAWADNRKAGAILRGMNPWFLAEQTNRPIMEKLVPAAKLGAFAKMVQFDLEQNPNMDVNEARQKFGAALDSIDNRMGQLSQNNMLMKNIVRAWMNAIVGRPGWNLGTIREVVGGGSFDIAQNLYDLSHGRPTRMSHRTAYLLALLLGGAVMNGVLTFLLSGDTPEGMDFVAPRDGGLTESGHESRIVLPLYLSKDIYSWATHPLRTLKAKMAQPLMVMGDLATNRDFYQRKIYGRGGVGLSNYLMHLFFPYVLSGTLQNMGRGEGAGKTLLPLVGIMPASRDAGLSKAEKILDEYRQEQMASTRPAPTDHSRARSQMMKAAERGDADAVRDLGMDGIEKGVLSKRDVDAAMKRIDTPLIVSEVQSVTDMEVLLNAWDAATPKERDMIEDTVRAKIARARLDPYKWTPRARKLAQKYFDVDIPTGSGADQAEDLGTPASLEGVA